MNIQESWKKEQKVYSLTVERRQYTIFKAQVHRCYSPVWFDVGQKWQILHYDRSDHLPIKLPVKGELFSLFNLI